MKIIYIIIFISVCIFIGIGLFKIYLYFKEKLEKEEEETALILCEKCEKVLYKKEAEKVKVDGFWHNNIYYDYYYDYYCKDCKPGL
jgi:predicted membrane protein